MVMGMGRTDVPAAHQCRAVWGDGDFPFWSCSKGGWKTASFERLLPPRKENGTDLGRAMGCSSLLQHPRSPED